MNTENQERALKLIKKTVGDVYRKIEDEVPETGKFLPRGMFCSMSRTDEWLGVISVAYSGRNTNERYISVGVTKSFLGKRTSYIVKTGTKAELLEYLSDENTPKEILDDMIELYKKAVENK